MSTKDKDLEKTGSDLSAEKTDTNDKNSRRSLLKKLAVGGIAGAALPTQWSRPVVDSVMLPAHAQTSDSSVYGGGGASGNNTPPGPAPADSIGEEILDFFTPPAQATPNYHPYCIEIRIDRDNNVTTGVTVLKLCYKECFATDGKPEDISATALTADDASGSNWSGTVDGRELILTNVDPNSNTVANSKYNQREGVITKARSCDCCEPL
jgi:hypothetical protein